tara:strand:- start:164 stop:796 length:633 start_codon:yes stop_codon:yes gene_type:complete
MFQNYIKKFFLVTIPLIFLSSCGLVGGKDEVDVSKNAVLSGPPLAIPPEFDIDAQNSNQQQSNQAYNLETLDEGEGDIGSFENEPIYQQSQNEDFFADDVPTMANTGDTQSFENYNPNINVTRKQSKNVQPRVQRSHRPAVPSDAYNFGETTLRRQKVYAKKSKDDFVGFGTQTFEQTNIQSDNNLSQEEEFLLQDIMTDDGFNQKGDSD